MRSSYRIIKNDNVDLKDAKGTVIETYIKRNEDLYKEDTDTIEDILDQGELIEEVRKQITMEMQLEKEKILEEARLEAESLKGEIKKAAHEKGYEEGYEVGYEDGTTQGLNHGMNEALKIKTRALDLIAQSEEYVEQYYKENKRSLLELSGSMAESIVHRSIDIADENIMMILNPLLKEYAHKENIIITCHPDNADFLKGRLDELEELSGEYKILILKDGNLEKNGCSLENSQQVMDLQIKTQIGNILKDIQNME